MEQVGYLDYLKQRAPGSKTALVTKVELSWAKTVDISLRPAEGGYQHLDPHKYNHEKSRKEILPLLPPKKKKKKENSTN